MQQNEEQDNMSHYYRLERCPDNAQIKLLQQTRDTRPSRHATERSRDGSWGLGTHFLQGTGPLESETYFPTGVQGGMRGYKSRSLTEPTPQLSEWKD